MKVLFIAAEAVPFIKTGGLGDVVGGLCRALRKKGADARVVIPKYGIIPASLREKMEHKLAYTVNVTWRKQYCGLQQLDYQGVPYYFLDNEAYFKREGVYGYFDEAERFAFFCKGVLEGLPYFGFRPRILHCHDWHTGLVPVFLEAFYRKYRFYQEMKTVFTIHNLKYQGVFTHWILDNILGLGPEYFREDTLEFNGQVNCMKGGIIYADLLTTVSPTYAQEIRYPFYGEGLDGLLRQKGNKLEGILNGIDVNEYNPKTDRSIDIPYGEENLEAKTQNKINLQKQLGLPVNEEIPLVGLVSRLTPQKGLELLIHILDELLSGQQLQIVLLGAGDEKYERFFSEAAFRYPEKIRVQLGFDEVLARKIYGAADLFLMPSRFEPCGLSQMIALRYGCIPIVRETGGLRDSIQGFNEDTKEGNGFSFYQFNAHELLFTIQKALRLFRHKETWRRLMKNAMRADFSWDRSADRYIELYDRLGR